MSKIHPTGSMLTDLFGDDNIAENTNKFELYLEDKNKVPFLHFDGENNFENTFFIKRANGDKMTFRDFYEEVDYKLNKGPIFYYSDAVVNYGFSTFVVFVQDGWFIEDPQNENSIVFYPWDLWGEVLFVKHRDLQAPVILLAHPTADGVPELSISPKLDMKKNVVMSSEDGTTVAKYTPELETLMSFAHSVIKRFWKVVENNRNKNTITMPMDLWYLLNKNSIESLNETIDEITETSKLAKKDLPEKITNAHIYAFYYIHFAKVTDDILSKEELHTIADKVCLWVKGGLSIEEAESKVRTTVTETLAWYNSLLQDESGETVETEIKRICEYLKTQLSEHGEYHKDFLQDLVDIAKSDGNFTSKEKELIEYTANEWGIDFKFTNIPNLSENNNVASNNNNENSSEFLENYPGDLYTENERFDHGPHATDHPLKIIPFANVFDDGEYKFEDLFRRFTHEEVSSIVKKLEKTKIIPRFQFVKDILEKKFDLDDKKVPFWFDPFIICGIDTAGLLYFDLRGLHMNLGPNTSSTELYNVSHVDLLSNLSVAKGYNGYWEGNISENADEDIITTLCAEWYNPDSDNGGAMHFIQTHGNKFASTLPIVEAIWNNWKPIVEKSKDLEEIILDEMNDLNFNSWQELIDWAKDSECDSEEEPTSDSIDDNSVEDKTQYLMDRMKNKSGFFKNMQVKVPKHKEDESISESSDENIDSDEFTMQDYVSNFRKDKPGNCSEASINLILSLEKRLIDTYKNEKNSDILFIYTPTGGLTLNANNKMRNGKFCQIRFGKSDRKEDGDTRFFVDLYLFKSKAGYKIDDLPNQVAQSPHGHEFYNIRLFSETDFETVVSNGRIDESLKKRRKNQMIVKRKGYNKKQLKKEYYKDLGIN